MDNVFWQGQGHYLGSIGYRFPVDDNVQSSSIHWSNHLDVRLTERFYLFTEAVWWHWTDAANTGLPLGVAGQDAFNLSSTNVAGNDLVTQSVVVKFKPSGASELGNRPTNFRSPHSRTSSTVASRAELILRY